MLQYVGKSVIVNQLSDSLLLQTHIDFINMHHAEISNLNQTRIYSNIGNLYYFGLKLCRHNNFTKQAQRKNIVGTTVIDILGTKKEHCRHNVLSFVIKFPEIALI